MLAQNYKCTHFYLHFCHFRCIKKLLCLKYVHYQQFNFSYIHMSTFFIVKKKNLHFLFLIQKFPCKRRKKKIESCMHIEVIEVVTRYLNNFFRNVFMYWGILKMDSYICFFLANQRIILPPSLNK